MLYDPSQDKLPNSEEIRKKCEEVKNRKFRAENQRELTQQEVEYQGGWGKIVDFVLGEGLNIPNPFPSMAEIPVVSTSPSGAQEGIISDEKSNVLSCEPEVHCSDYWWNNSDVLNKFLHEVKAVSVVATGDSGVEDGKVDCPAVSKDQLYKIKKEKERIEKLRQSFAGQIMAKMEIQHQDVQTIKNAAKKAVFAANCLIDELNKST